ncbi:hypothetical protein JGU71_28170 [Antrihabitans sp. YC3-6]|uniref:Gp28/Gp37-like domain-containing protein n=1 Tax=Antrihabitans stalagmiti TaxID=2799499 RepID=A0A934NX08_9NOCA|nr:hypothetical protein [Antrihabitans stalagmiti]MBJ8342772.1 hypothetical protein [Antrihabitans stalagmiti]
MAINFAASLKDQILEGASLIDEFEHDLDRERNADILIRAYDGTFTLQHVIRCDDGIDLTEIENDTGTGMITLDGDHPAAPWAWKLRDRLISGQKIDMFVLFDYVGKRYSARVDDVVMKVDDLGVVKIELMLEHDYALLKARTLWPTPTTPAGFQPIKVFLLGGPADWAAATALWLNLARAHGNPAGLGWTTDPISVTTADYRNWPIVIKPFSHAQAKASGVVSGLVVSRMKSWHEACADMLNDANVTTVVRRYVRGDPLPWPGAVLSYGTLVVSFVFQGALADEVTGGLFEGIGQLIRIFLNAVVEGIGLGSPLPVETGEQPITGQPPPPAYFQPGTIGQVPDHPYVFYPANSPGIASFEAHLRNAKYLRFTTGGHSAPGVNELLGAIVQAIGDAFAAIPFVPPLGGVADALLKPFYEDVVLAFMTVYLSNRAQSVSKFGPYETFLPGSDKAYTLTATMVLRTAILAAATKFSAAIEIVDALPWRIGANGLGDMDLGTRILMQAPVDWDNRIYSQRIKKLQLVASPGSAPTWLPTVGAIEPGEDAFAKAMRHLANLVSGLTQLGLF